jgi:hypothetical protein
MNSSTGRTEKRNREAVAVSVWTVDEPDVAVSATTENVSAHGARIITNYALRRSTGLSVVRSGTLARLDARVVYCHPVNKNAFVVGLSFRENVWDYWPRSGELATPESGVERQRSLNR